MALFKCKMCGGDLEVKEGEKVTKCPYCETTQTIPNQKDEQTVKLINRGNLLRNQGEFDKAYGIFSQLLNSETEDAELYWNLLLCKYGITYVDDYDGKKIPTINRMSRTSILDDDDYKKVLSLADVVAKDNYVDEANKIAKIQQGILKIVNSEEPYDIFISYKESDETGDRTRDSVLAQEIYDTFTKEGYRVFLSRITLSNIIGKEYEPYIYSALYSSKIMLLVCTDESYVNSVWVKNEWTRFLGMMKEDKSKTLIPCYRDLDPYDLPKEIRNLQGLDMSKLGFIQDLKTGVCKILGKKKAEIAPSSTPAKTENKNESLDLVTKMIKRGFSFLEQEKGEQAKKMFEESLLYEERTYAYLGLLCLKYNCSTVEELYALDDKNIANQPLFKKALSVANEQERETLNNIVKSITDKTYKKDLAKYNAALKLKNDGNYHDAIQAFNAILDFSDSKNQIKECENLILEGKKAILYERLCKQYQDKYFKGVLETFQELYKLDKDYKDSRKLQDESIIALCNNLLKRNDYVKVRKLLNENRCFSKEYIDETYKKCDQIERETESKQAEHKRRQNIYQECDVIKENETLSDLEAKLNKLLTCKGDDCYPEYAEQKLKTVIRKKKAKKGIFITITTMIVLAVGGGILANVIVSKINDKKEAERLSSIEERQSQELSSLKKKYAAPVFNFEEKTMTYGVYPQTVVDDESLIAKLNDLTGDSQHENKFYYYNEEYYYPVKANPNKSNYVFSNGSNIVSSTKYWFKVEPIKWKMINASEDSITLTSAALITRQAFAASTYANSDARKWINGGFYNKAFCLDDSLILTSEVDNSHSMQDTCGNKYYEDNTNDKLYLLSYQDIYQRKYELSTDTTDPYNTGCKITDYIRACGAYCDLKTGYEYNGDYWTRSLCSSSGNPSCVNSNDTINHSVGNRNYNACLRPCMKISHKWTDEEKALVNKKSNQLLEGKVELKEKYGKPVVDLANNTVKYGIYPQTLVSDEALITKLDSSSIYDSANGWSYYNGEYYKKFKANPYDSSYTYDNGETIVSGTYYWFKCEQVEWKIMKMGDDGTYQLITSKLIDCRYYSSTPMDDSFANSSIRKWLNGTFYNQIFLDQSYVQETSDENKFYFLSEGELCSSDYGFSSDNASRYCKTTDYARANYACIYTDDETKYNGMYWTRTYYKNGGGVFYVIKNGFNDRDSESSIICIRPCVNIKISE